MTKLLHIGLPKCGSTALQKLYLPAIANKLNIDFINLHKNKFFKINKNKINFHVLEKKRNLEKKLPKKFIISNEGLFSKNWEFCNIEKSFNILKKNFSQDTIILIVLRNPYELLNSIYIQNIQEMRLIHPKKFFSNINPKKNNKLKKNYNLYNFDYEKLINLYKSYFTKVVVIKYEKINDFNFLKKIFDLNEKFFLNLKNKNKIYNKSISKFGINCIFFLNKFFDIEKIQKKINQKIKKPKNKIDIIKNKFIRIFLLRDLFQIILDKILPYKKYYLNKADIPININKMIIDYNKIRSYDN